uniref:Uncharacterized protein n=1 Tax=Hyaloperonospora arabidopsidis (strain Emoy2) TaxID=559515 RepID=M4BDY0_HYAAE
MLHHHRHHNRESTSKFTHLLTSALITLRLHKQYTVKLKARSRNLQSSRPVPRTVLSNVYCPSHWTKVITSGYIYLLQHDATRLRRSLLRKCRSCRFTANIRPGYCKAILLLLSQLSVALDSVTCRPSRTN